MSEKKGNSSIPLFLVRILKKKEAKEGKDKRKWRFNVQTSLSLHCLAPETSLIAA